MTALNGLQAVFGAAFASLYDDGVLHKTTVTDDGAGGFLTSTADSPVKVLVQTLSDADRAASGLPLAAVNLSLLRAGLVSTVDIDDGVTVNGVSYRILRSEADAVPASYTLAAVPVSP